MQTFQDLENLAKIPGTEDYQKIQEVTKSKTLSINDLPNSLSWLQQ
jgi:hypothetical protein